MRRSDFQNHKLIKAMKIKLYCNLKIECKTKTDKASRLIKSSQKFWTNKVVGRYSFRPRRGTEEDSQHSNRTNRCQSLLTKTQQRACSTRSDLLAKSRKVRQVLTFVKYPKSQLPARMSLIFWTYLATSQYSLWWHRQVKLLAHALPT